MDIREINESGGVGAFGGGDQLQIQGVRAPRFVFEPDRWAQMRGENVEQVASLWREQPDLVKVLMDPKLNDSALVVLRKERFEQMLKILADLENGQAGLRIELETFGEHLALIQQLVKERAQELNEQDSLVRAVHLMSKMFSRTSAKLFAFSRGKQVAPAPLSDEEMKALAEEAEE